MSNYLPLTQNQTQTQSYQPYQPYSATQYFPQPQGSIYMIGASNDVANVPVGAGLSAAICLREGIMYLKTIQNGSPMLLGYRLSSLEGGGAEPIQEAEKAPENEKIAAILKEYDDRIKQLEQMLKTTKKGGSTEWPI